MKKMLLAFACIAIAVLSSCSSTTPAVASSQYVSAEKAHFGGRYTAMLNCTLFEADKAVCATARRAHLLQNSRRNCQSFMTYEYKDIYDNKISIVLRDMGSEQVKIHIIIGKLGDKEFSQELLQAIDEELHAIKEN